jgi:hypothetical protein
MDQYLNKKFLLNKQKIILYFTYTFFFPPFFPPLVKRLFLPMAICYDQSTKKRKINKSRGFPSEKQKKKKL